MEFNIYTFKVIYFIITLKYEFRFCKKCEQTLFVSKNVIFIKEKYI